jgi:copper(I)-binding protein
LNIRNRPAELKRSSHVSMKDGAPGQIEPDDLFSSECSSVELEGIALTGAPRRSRPRVRGLPAAWPCVALLSSLVLLPAAPAWADQASGMLAKDARITVQAHRGRAAPTASLYLQLTNRSPEPVRLVGVMTPMAARIDLYEATAIPRAGRVERPIEAIEVPPGVTLVVGNGLNLRLSDLPTASRYWLGVPMTLRYADGSQTVVTASVSR